MSENEVFCPECGANVGPGTLDVIGCPLCGYDEDVDLDGGEDEEERVRKPLVLRVSRHPATDSHRAALKAAFGDDVEVVTRDILYRDNPVQSIVGEFESILRELPAGFDYDLVAVEAAGPEAVLLELVKGFDTPVIRPVFRREGGRVAVVGKDADGRDIFDVERYERLAVETRPTIVGQPLG